MKHKISEGFLANGAPDLKYYAFDWDDNIVIMPTRIMLLDSEGDIVGMTTSDFAKHKHKIGKVDFEHKGHIIVGYDDKPFRNFKESGDRNFLIDAMLAEPGPSWPDFMECINNGSIFAIITARGHNPLTIKEAVYNYTISEFNGIDREELVTNLKKYRAFSNLEDFGDYELIKSYLDMCKFYPVFFGKTIDENPEAEKIAALDEFVLYVKNLATSINKRAYLRNNVKNSFLPTVGFSDDDPNNLKAIKQHLDKQTNNIVQIYSTEGGKKIKY